MSRKTTATLSSVPVETAARRPRRARRAKTIVTSPILVRPVIDLTRSDARKALASAFPIANAGSFVLATATEEAALEAYLVARDAETRAKAAKEAAANVLCYAIGEAEELRADGGKVTWKFQRGDVDRTALCKHLGIETEIEEQFRRPPARVIRVTETIES